ncbi:hypothetical protein AKJ39_03615 [candidate division MSBL1 archaeon SCGC-AAA259J03]|uniref:Amidohydrolase-related domain-containing protein n=1 Tax=candidate division MSBL1 archaeon SCGC-AAA259J03 TaxID=1698269 RepID=A0A656YVJ6_9EURY|nr:hypothetical protein AKJ39_03615 [candidate division MSBL1 archaeon SCGC-AAA259J03]
MVIDLVINNGKVVTAEGIVEADVAIDGGKVVSLGYKSILPDAEREIDASHKYVIPGGIDPHTHFETPFQGAMPEETWETGTKAAALGGTTSVVKFSIQEEGSPLMDTVEKDIERASNLSVIDFALHGSFIDVSDIDSVVQEIKPIIGMGVSSFKEFLIYKKQGWMIDDWGLYRVANEVGKNGGILAVHAENAPIGEGLREQMTQEGKTAPEYHPKSKPNFVEAEAIQRAASIANFADSPFYIVHMSTQEGVQILREFQNKGACTFAETCTHYLKFTDKMHKGDMGVLSLMSPPLRKKEDIKTLWNGLSDGTVAMVGSDHAPYSSEPKQKGYQERGFISVPNGAPGVLERLPIMYSEGVRKNRISLSKFVEITSTNPAKLMGMYPQKGTIAPGSDADIVVLDPEKEVTLGADWYDDVDWSLYENIKVQGFPQIVLSKGDLIVENDEFYGEAGRGQFIERDVPNLTV